MTCEHILVSSTRERGPYCCDCGRPLVSMFLCIPRDTPTGSLLWAMRQANAPHLSLTPKETT